MPTDSLTAELRPAWSRGWPEIVVGLLAAVTFLGCLGSVDVWGKREQRASAEALDTIEHHHWLVAEIQGRPRLEKPPLPRWMTAALLLATGRRDEWIVRLPDAACALGTIALIYALGRRMGGRSLGLAASLILCSSGLFVGEMRQAGNDGLLAFCTTLALYAAWRALEVDEPDADRARRTGRSWRLLFFAALGLGFLSKGPIVLLLTSVAIIPYLIQTGRPGALARQLLDAPGALIFVAMAASWPAAVYRHDPNAMAIWLMEISEKTGILGTLLHRRYPPLARQWPNMMFPWSVVAIVSLILPFLTARSPGDDGSTGARRTGRWSPIWFAWWWAVGNMGIFCFWSVAKASYYLPCMPGMALLAGAAWIRLARRARDDSSVRGALAARVVLQIQWVLLFVAAVVGPIAARPWISPPLWPWTLVLAAALIAAVVSSARAWRRGADAMALAPITAAWALGIVVVFGWLAPAENPRRSHRELARVLGRLVPPGMRTVYFFNEVDEGLWFYLDGVDLVPVPGTHPRYSTAYDLAEAYRGRRDPTDTIDVLDVRREALEKQALFRWIDRRATPASLLLMRSNLYDRYARELTGRVTPVLRESGLARKELVLLRALGQPPVAASDPRTRK